jgi:hypothetical protein
LTCSLVIVWLWPMLRCRIVLSTTISLIFRGTPQSCNCIVNAPCVLHSVFFTNPRSCLMKASFGGEAVSRWRMRIKTEARAVFDFGIRCSPSVAITRPDVSRAPVACLAIYRIHPSHLLPYPHPSLHSPICPASSHLTLVLITTSLLFLPVILLNHVFASSSWSVLPHPRNHPSFFCQCRS